jgi:hypothetical protein
MTIATTGMIMKKVCLKLAKESRNIPKAAPVLRTYVILK